MEINTQLDTETRRTLCDMSLPWIGLPDTMTETLTSHINNKSKALIDYPLNLAVAAAAITSRLCF
jgi:hypothetical protein